MTREDDGDEKDAPTDQESQDESEKLEVKNNKQLRRENSVVVGFTGKKDSVVAAYLLRKQGFDVIGIAIDFFSTELDQFDHPPVLATMDEPEGYLPPEELREQLKPHCHLKNLDEIKKVADALEIDFYAVKAYEIYQESVIDPLFASKLDGKNFYPCLSCHREIIRLLCLKAETLGVDKVATGHYAKINFMARDKIYNVIGAQDKEFDQSYLLADLTQVELMKLVLPLSTIRKSEVHKIVESMKWNVIEGNKVANSCFQNNKAVAQWIDRRVAVDLRKNGQVIRFEDETFIGDHDGIHYFTLGENSDVVKSQGMVETDFEVVMIKTGQATVMMAPSAELKYKELWLNNLKVAKHTDLSRPFDVYCQFGPKLERHKAVFYPKALGFCYLVLEEELEGMNKAGNPIFIYDKKNIEGAKLIGKGNIHLHPEIDATSRLKVEEDNFDEEDEKEKKAKAKLASKFDIKL